MPKKGDIVRVKPEELNFARYPADKEAIRDGGYLWVIEKIDMFNGRTQCLSRSFANPNVKRIWFSHEIEEMPPCD